MSEFNFKSQVCTDRNQSERLLALGLKKETADMCYQIAYWDCGLLKECSPSLIPHNIIDGDRFIPAWSLGRLIEMTKLKVTLFLYGVKISHPQWERAFVKRANVWDNLCDCIEWLIKEGYFNKEYLEE